MFSSERCVELSIANHLDHTAHLICTGQHREVWEVPSKDRSKMHELVYVYASHTLYCDCPAALNGQPNCSHKGAVIGAVNQRAAAYAAARGKVA